MTNKSSKKQSTLSASALYRDGKFIFAEFYTSTPAMADCLRLANHAANCDLSVLITGESGTGKNLLAQAIHNASARKDGPFVAVNMSALSDSLIQSELFGHEKGAFTGADKQHRGQFEMADNGTLVLDEIADMSISAQPKILHAVEYKQFQRLGGEALIKANVRVIAITNQDLDELSDSKKFRLDLMYRLREITIEVPPVRERVDDIPLLCETILRDYCNMERRKVPKITDQAMTAMKNHSWPGNLREFKGVLRRATVLALEGVIEPEHLGPIGGAADETTKGGPNENLSLANLEKRYILRIMEKMKGNKLQVAKTLGISRSTLDRKLESYQ